MQRGHWARKFKAIALVDGRSIASLADARDLLASLPAPRQSDRHWKYASELLLRAADRDEKYSTMDARAQMARALKEEGLVRAASELPEAPRAGGGGIAEAFDPHSWFFVVRCEACLDYIGLGEAPPIDAPVEPKFVELRVMCPRCGAERGYRASEVSRQLRRV